MKNFVLTKFRRRFEIRIVSQLAFPSPLPTVIELSRNISEIMGNCNFQKVAWHSCARAKWGEPFKGSSLPFSRSSQSSIHNLLRVA